MLEAGWVTGNDKAERINTGGFERKEEGRKEEKKEERRKEERREKKEGAKRDTLLETMIIFHKLN